LELLFACEEAGCGQLAGHSVSGFQHFQPEPGQQWGCVPEAQVGCDPEQVFEIED
jgi:hypothetical protein